MKSKVLLSFLTIVLAFNAHAQFQRLNTYVVLTGNPRTIKDSLVFHYSGNRGGYPASIDYTSLFPVGVIKYDSIINNHGFSATSNTSYMAARAWRRTYDGSDNILLDVKEVWDNSMPGNYNKFGYQYTYDPVGRVETKSEVFWANGIWRTVFRDSFFYNVNGDLVTQNVHDMQTGSGAGPIAVNTAYTYTSGKLSSSFTRHYDLTGNLTNGYKYDFTYDSNGDLLTQVDSIFATGPNAYYALSRKTYTYNSNHLPLTMTIESYTLQTPVWTLFSRHNYNYNTNNLLVSEDVENWDAASSSWKSNYRTTHTHSTNNDVIATGFDSWNSTSSSFVPVGKRGTSYNNFHQMLTDSTQQWVNNAWQSDTIILLNTLPVTNGIENIGITQADASVFPVPANAVLNLSVNWKEEQPFTVAIYNAQGVLVRQWAEHKISEYRKAIPVNMLNSGRYIISITGTKEHAIKQFIVAH